MAQSDEEAADESGRMPLNAGGAGYGSVAGSGMSSRLSGSESANLLIPEPEPEPEPFQQWRPMTKDELQVAAGGPGWRKVRCYLVMLFWMAWMAMLATCIAVITLSPRPVATPLKWWQKSLFYQLQAEESEGIDALCEQLPYLRSLGIGALILEALFDKKASPLNLNATGEGFGTLPQILHLLSESKKADLKVVLNVCEVDLLGPQGVAGDADETSNLTAHHALRFWLEQGVAGFAICDTDAAYSEETLLEWKGVFKEFSREDEERIVVVRQTGDVLPSLKNSSRHNVTLVDVVMRSILPPSQHLLSPEEVANSIEMHLQTREEDIWPSWTVGGNASHDLKKLLLVLIMTLPGSPAVQYDTDIDPRQNVSMKVGLSHGDTNNPSDTRSEKEKKQRSAVALFTSLSHSRAREEALLFGSFTFLPFTASIDSSSSSNSTLPSPSSPPILAFLRSWGCVHFLVLLNVGSEVHSVDPSWAPSLPKAGVFVANTRMDRLGSTTLDTLEVRPREAIVIKLFETESYS
ncbi:4F2 cell-surface antigen heavy chain [Etheostoma cragini]|uniref:4F2 cell-surface antigen heavy chain n=1 Tax=Etheostoma cragini TaxID=417921 RepID=UPI00155DEF35|nr:4F2 cell-surface antigen heavy chain [Etheostoma cragini]